LNAANEPNQTPKMADWCIGGSKDTDQETFNSNTFNG